MESDRSIKELLEIMLENCTEEKFLKHRIYGLCQLCKVISELGIISVCEKRKLLDYIQTAPCPGRMRKGYWWNPSMVYPRRRWIKKHIKLNTK